MGSSFNEAEIQIEVETTLRQGMRPDDFATVIHLKDRILAEMARRRLSKNRCAQEMDLAIPTFNKILRGETNLSRGTLGKITSWLNSSSEKPFGRSHST